MLMAFAIKFAFKVLSLLLDTPAPTLHVNW